MAIDELVRAVFAALGDPAPATQLEMMRMALGEELQALWPEAAAPER